MFSQTITKTIISAGTVLLAGFIAVSCSNPISGDKEIKNNTVETSVTDYAKTTRSISGWVTGINVTGDSNSRSRLSDYTIVAESAVGTHVGTVDGTTGKYTITGIPLEADFQVQVTKTGYKTFYSTVAKDLYNDLSDANGTNSVVTDSRYDLYNIALIPTEITSPAVSLNVYDENTGASITSGYYKVTLATAGSAALTNINTVNNANNNDGDGITTFELTADFNPVSGTVAAGIAAGALNPYQDYSIEIYGVSGYQNASGVALNLGGSNGTVANTSNATDFNTNVQVDIALTSYTRTSAPILLTDTLTDANGVLTALPTGRTITFYFDRAITLDPQWNRVNNLNDSAADSATVTNSTLSTNTYVSGTQFITAVNSTDTDNDGDINVRSSDNSLSAGGADVRDTATDWITASVPTSAPTTLVVTIGPDSSILGADTTTNYDTDDDLTFTLDLSSLQVRATDDGSEGTNGWTTWNPSTTTLLIRDSSDEATVTNP